MLLLIIRANISTKHPLKNFFHKNPNFIGEIFGDIKRMSYICTRNTEVLTKIAGWSSGSSLGS